MFFLSVRPFPQDFALCALTSIYHEIFNRLNNWTRNLIWLEGESVCMSILDNNSLQEVGQKKSPEYTSKTGEHEMVCWQIYLF